MNRAQSPAMTHTTARHPPAKSHDQHRVRLSLAHMATVVMTPLLVALPGSAQAQSQALPRINLLVEVRVVRAADVDPGDSTAPAARATTLGTRDLADELPQAQQVRVANGQRGLVRYSRRLPVLWMDSVSAGGGGTGGGRSGRAGASYQLIWLEAGQSLVVMASWPGGRAPARVDLSLGNTTLDYAPGKAIPARQTRNVSTTLATPLARWTTFAALGQPPDSRSGQAISTRDIATSSARQLFQVRVSAD